MRFRIFPVLITLIPFIDNGLCAQNFFFGADLSYANEMEDCGVAYRENGTEKDVYQIFAGKGCNLVRLRLWHTPSWYDTLNAGKRYGDFQDVRSSIQRAKTLGMKVLLDFHLSDFWADPGRQRCPAAWLGVVDNLPLLRDSLHRYISQTLLDLEAEGLLPDLVQIGNETNKGILLSPAVDAAGWSLDWNRNSQLFKTAIQAVRDVETSTGKTIKVALHIAGPSNAGWLMQGFWNNGVTDFDIIGLSYYWAWHMPTTIADAGNVVTQLRQLYPGKDVMILEIGYIWTTQANDNAPNLITQTHPAYAPASPDNQRRWLVDMTQELINKGAKGVVYWEPDWVSSPCRTPWVQGSSYENATFFDFQNNLIPDGGVQWMTYPYDNLVDAKTPASAADIRVSLDSNRHVLDVSINNLAGTPALSAQVVGINGQVIKTEKCSAADGMARWSIPLPVLPAGIYYVVVYDGAVVLGTQGFEVSHP